jgi:tetratricopeptide (TPR) repeat protein
LGDLRMKGREIQMIKLVDGKRSLRDVVAQCGAEDKKEAYKALYGLFILGFVGFAEHATTRVPKAAARKAADDAERVSPGYALRADDLIREAMDSVDRIRRESAQRVPPDVEIETPTLDEPEDLLEPLDLDGAADSPGGTPVPAAPAVDFGYAEDFGLATEETPAPAKAIARPRPEDRRSPVEDETQALELEQPLDLEAARPRPDAPVEAEGPAMFGADHFRGTIAEAHDRDSLPMDPDEAVQRAEFFLDKLDYADALPLLRFAHAKKPGDPGIAPLLGWAIFHAGEGSREAFREAETLLREVTKTDPKNWRAFLALGRIYKATKQRDFAELHLVRALELNKDCAEAKEEIKNLYR